MSTPAKPSATWAELSLEIERRVVYGLDNEWGDVVWIIIDGARLTPINGVAYVGQPPVELLAAKAFVAPEERAYEVSPLAVTR